LPLVSERLEQRFPCFFRVGEANPHLLFISVYSYFTKNLNNLCFGLIQQQASDVTETTVNQMQK